MSIQEILENFIAVRKTAYRRALHIIQARYPHARELYVSNGGSEDVDETGITVQITEDLSDCGDTFYATLSVEQLEMSEDAWLAYVEQVREEVAQTKAAQAAYRETQRVKSELALLKRLQEQYPNQ
jgi:hypothetical protein